MTPVFPLSSSSFGDYQRYLSMLAGNSAYVAPAPLAFDLLETEILTSSASSVSFENLVSTYGSDYQHLQLRIVGRDDNTANTNLAQSTIIPNSYSGSSMTTHWLEGSASSISSDNNLSASQFRIKQSVVKNASTSGLFGVAIVDILDAFSTSKYTTFRAFAGGIAGEKSVVLASGLWPSMDALDTLDVGLLTPGTSYLSGSRFSIYGLKVE